MSELTTALRKVPKLVALLASNSAGEVLAAVEALKRVLNEHRYDLNDLALWIRLPSVSGTGRREYDRPPLWSGMTEGERHRWLLRVLIADCLNERSVEFVKDIIERKDFSRLSDKQEAWLNNVLRAAYLAGVRA